MICLVAVKREDLFER